MNAIRGSVETAKEFGVAKSSDPWAIGGAQFYKWGGIRVVLFRQLF